MVKTDAAGAFSVVFPDVPYSTAFWVLPPVGNVPKNGPDPMFIMRFLDKPSTDVSLQVKESEVIYGVSRLKFGNTRVAPIDITGNLEKTSRGGDKAIVAELVVKNKRRN